MSAFAAGYEDAIEKLLDRTISSGSKKNEYIDTLRSFDVLEKNASKNSDYLSGFKLASSRISSLGEAGFGYFSCLAEVDGLLSQGTSPSQVLEACSDNLMHGRGEFNPEFEDGFKYACRVVLDDGLNSALRDIAKMGLMP